MAGLLIYRRNLPHRRLPDSVYLVTWRLHPSQPDLSSEERTVVANAIKHFNGKRYTLYAYVVMNDHCHVIVKPRKGFELQQILYSWKSFTTHQFHKHGSRSGQVWQREFFDRNIRDEDEFWEKMNYVINNPQKRWPEMREYVWVEWFAWE